MYNFNAMIRVRLWKNDDSVDLTIMKDEYRRLLDWASSNDIQIYTLN